MELWIRSQDRKNLLKVEKIFCLNTCPEMESIGRNVILNKEWIGKKDCIKFGEYKTKERALEVLDEIQNKMKEKYDRCWITKDGLEIANTTKDTIIYEMPKE